MNRSDRVSVACPFESGVSHCYSLQVEYDPVENLRSLEGGDQPKANSTWVPQTRIYVFVCPNTKQQFQTDITVYVPDGNVVTSIVASAEGNAIPSDQQGRAPAPVVTNVQSVTPENQALIDVGKSLIQNSLNVGKDFCKFMVPITTGAIALYTGLLKFVLGAQYVPNNQSFIPGLGIAPGLIVALPALLYILAALVFAWGVLPEGGNISLDVPSTIRTYRESYIKRSRIIIIVGFGLFALANLSAVAVIVHTIMGQAQGNRSLV